MKEYAIILTFGKGSVLIDVDTGYRIKHTIKAYVQKLAEDAVRNAGRDLWLYFPIDYEVYEYTNPKDNQKELEARNLVRYKHFPKPRIELDETWQKASPSFFTNPKIILYSAMPTGTDFCIRGNGLLNDEYDEANFFDMLLDRFPEAKTKDFSFIPMGYRIEEIVDFSF